MGHGAIEDLQVDISTCISVVSVKPRGFVMVLVFQIKCAKAQPLSSQCLARKVVDMEQLEEVDNGKCISACQCQTRRVVS